MGTPRTSSGNGVGQYETNERGDRGRLEAQVDRLLKTPTSSLATNGGAQHSDKRKEGGHGPTLADEIEHLLPTPCARDHKGTGPSEANRHSPSMAAIGHLLPTPETINARGGRRLDRDGTPYGDRTNPTLIDAVETLLPTPRATDGTKGGPNQRGSSGDLMLPSAVQLLPTPTVGAARVSNSPGELARKSPALGAMVHLMTPTDGDRTDSPWPDGRLF
jgi:hypothetical protein